MAHFNIKIDDDLNFAVEKIAKANNVSNTKLQ